MSDKAYNKGSLMDRLEALGLDWIDIGLAISDENFEKSHKLLIETPNITKKEFLSATGIGKRLPNAIPHKFSGFFGEYFAPSKFFNAIKEYSESGNDINSFPSTYFPSKYSLLYSFLDNYYQQIIYTPTADSSDCDDAQLYEDHSDELLLPLNERTYDIQSELEWLIDNGADLNGGDDFKPLMLPVAFLDYSMTEFMLDHGADPNYDICEGDLPYGCGNYYIDDLDTSALFESYETEPDPAVFDLILKIAVLFARRGVTDLHTHCISIDGKTRQVSINQATAKF